MKNTKTVLNEDGDKKEKKRMVSKKYTFYVNGENRQVCKQFFCSTLALGTSYVDHALENKNQGHFKGTERIGKQTPTNKINPERIDLVKEHIKSFPRVSGHYTRKDSNRDYLGAELNITKMYELYQQKCEASKCEPINVS